VQAISLQPQTQPFQCPLLFCLFQELPSVCTEALQPPDSPACNCFSPQMVLQLMYKNGLYYNQPPAGRAGWGYNIIKPAHVCLFTSDFATDILQMMLKGDNRCTTWLWLWTTRQGGRSSKASL